MAFDYADAIDYADAVAYSDTPAYTLGLLTATVSGATISGKVG